MLKSGLLKLFSGLLFYLSIAIFLLSNPLTAFSVRADTLIWGQGFASFTNNWSDEFNWINFTAPTESPYFGYVDEVLFQTIDNPLPNSPANYNLDTDIVLNKMIIGQLDFLDYSNNDWTASNGSKLTVREAIIYSNGGYPSQVGQDNLAEGRANIFMPITLGTTGDPRWSDSGPSVAFSTQQDSISVDPDNRITFHSTIDTNGRNLVLNTLGAEIVINTNVTGTGSLIKNGSKRATITQNVNYSGQTIVNAGDLVTTGSGRLPNSSDLIVMSGGRFLLAINNTADAINGLYGDGRVGINAGNTLVIGNYDGFNSEGNGNFTGELFGIGGNLTKRGIDGIQTLNGQINLGGEIFVEEGILNIGSAATIQNTPAVEVAEGATLNMENNGDYGRIIVDGTANLSGDTTFTSMRIANANGLTDSILTQSGGSIQSAQAIFGFNGEGEFIQESGDNAFTSLQLGLEGGSAGYYQLNSGTVQASGATIGSFGEGVFDHFGGDHNVGTLSLAEGEGSIGQYSLEGGTLNTEVTELASPPDLPENERGNATFVNDGGTHNITERLELGNGGGTGVDDSGEGYYEITGGVTNADRINIWSTGTLFINGGTVNARVIDNRFTGLLDFAAGTLSSEIIFGSLVNVGGVLSPGNSPGLLTISGDYTQESDGSLLIELGGNTPEIEYDVVEVEGSANLDGTLDVVLYDGFIPNDGDSFDILKATSVLGAFSIVNFPAVQGILWELQYLIDEIGTTDVVRLIATAQPVPLPASVWMFLAALGALGLLKRKS